MTALPDPTIDDIARTAHLFCSPDLVAELRAVKCGPMGTVSGYFDNPDELAKSARSLDANARVPSTYVTLNPLNPDLLARCVNRAKRNAIETASDKDAVRRRWLLVDADPVRPSGISSTDEEHHLALARAEAIAEFLDDADWPDPIKADSGNGAHLLYRVDLPNDAESLRLVTSALESIAQRFDDEFVKIDRKVGNAARITKFYGTLTRKGDNTEARPHRRSRLLEVPAEVGVVSRDQLAALAPEVPKQDRPAPARTSSNYLAPFDVPAFIARNGIDVRHEKPYEGGTRWLLEVCPWDPVHTDRSAFIIQWPSGAVSAGCSHNSCSGRDWADLREKFEPRAERETRRTPPKAPEPSNDEVATGLMVDEIAEYLAQAPADLDDDGRVAYVQPVIAALADCDDPLEVGMWQEVLARAPWKLGKRVTNRAIKVAARPRLQREAELAREARMNEQRARWGDKPEIKMVGGNLPEVMAKLEDALLNGPVPLFQRGSALVRIIRVAAVTVRGIARGENSLQIIPVTETWLAEYLCRVAVWLEPSGKDDWRQVNCPVDVARAYLARAGSWRMPALVALVETPTLRPDGSILDVSGYDATTGLYMDLGEAKFPRIPKAPTREDAIAALDVLRRVIKSFPWTDPHDEAIALAAILTAVIRRALKSAPMFMFNAPKMGTGKTLLANVVSLIATGRAPTVMTHAPKPEEEVKRLVAILMAGDLVVCIDNISAPFGSDAMCTILTEEVFTERLLGANKNATLPTCVTWVGTGNNVVVVGDITTRIMRCDLDPQVERPEEREFDVNLHEWIPANRGPLVAAALTVLRAFHVAGYPHQGLKEFGRFEAWSRWVRGALVWCGMPDPCLSRADLEEDDPVRVALVALLEAWHATFGNRPATVHDAVASGGDPEGENLKRAMLDIAGHRGEVNTRRLGTWLRDHANRWEDGLRAVKTGTRSGAVLYVVQSNRENGEFRELSGVGPRGRNKFNFMDHTAEAENKTLLTWEPTETNPRNSPNSLTDEAL